MGFGVWGLGFRVWGLGFEIQVPRIVHTIKVSSVLRSNDEKRARLAADVDVTRSRAKADAHPMPETPGIFLALKSRVRVVTELARGTHVAHVAHCVLQDVDAWLAA